MNYLKSYQTFESRAGGLREEVKELLANLEDDGFIITFSYMGEDNGYVYIKKSPYWDEDFRADEVSGDIIRMCEFLSDRYLCDINIVGVGSMLRAKPVTLNQFQKMESKIYTIKVNLFSTKDDIK